MASHQTKEEGATRVIGTIEHAEHMSLEAVQNFLDTVDSVFPDVGGDDRLRRKIIDSASR